jgi:transcription initiation factor TFIID subunit 2
MIINKTLEAAEQAHPPVVERVKAVPRLISSAPKVLPEPAPLTTSSSIEAPRQLNIQPIASSSRPTIKLKVGAHSKVQDTPSEQSSKPSKRKTKIPESPSSNTPDAPPPPYVDDGSHDILQEVLAIEREKNQQRQKSTSEKEKVVPSAIPSKRKKIDDVDDDDILELVAPLKKERPSPPESSSSSISIKKPGLAPSIKIKKDKALEVPRPPTTTVFPGTSLKGKEKEVASTPPSAGSNKPRKPIPYTPINEKKCKDLLKVLSKIPESYLFTRPVDPVIDGCPTYVFLVSYLLPLFSNGCLDRYYDEIQHPMDFGTMLTNLNENKYQSMEQFKKDMELVFSNCRQFNTPDTYPTKCAAIVEKVFKKEWPKAMERKLSWTEKRGLQGIMTAFVKEPMSVHFSHLGTRQLNLF